MTKNCVVLIETDIFNKAVKSYILKPIRNLFTPHDVNMLRYCGEMTCVEEIYILLEILTSLLKVKNHNLSLTYESNSLSCLGRIFLDILCI